MRTLFLPLAAAACLLCGCPTGTAIVVGIDANAIGRVCAPDLSREMRASQAIASAYRLLAVRDLQLVPTDEPGLAVAVYRLGPDDARPQEVFAATIAETAACAAVLAQSDACDPFAFSPVYLPRFADDAVAVLPASFARWDGINQPVVDVTLAALARDPEEGFPEASARGRCLFRLATLPDGRRGPATLFHWAESVGTVERARDGKDYVTDAATTVEAVGDTAPRPLTVESIVLDVACADVDDRRAACVERCALQRPPDADGEVPDAVADCTAECSAVAADPGRSCTATRIRVTDWLAPEVLPDGRIAYETTGQEETRTPLDPDCLAAPDAAALDLAARAQRCRVEGYSSGLPHDAPGSGSPGSR